VIDLHAHLLPGIDDGARDMEAAVGLAAGAAAAGVTTMAATPHLRPDFPRVRPEELADRAAAVREALAAAGVGLDVVVGAEVDLHRGLAAGDRELELASYGQRGRDLLVETPYGHLPPDFEALLFRLQARGYRVLLAHPERNADFQRAPRRLAALADGGTLLQVTADSLAAGGRRSGARRTALALVAEGVAHVIASDAHAGLRRTTLSDGVAAAARVAPRRAEWMATAAPAAVLAGEPLPAPPPERARRTGLRGRLGAAR
jgi:protein-tyrosine phosphatase